MKTVVETVHEEYRSYLLRKIDKHIAGLRRIKGCEDMVLEYEKQRKEIIDGNWDSSC